MKADKTGKVKRWICPYTTKNVQVSKGNVDRLRAYQDYLNDVYKKEFAAMGKKGASQNDAIDFLMWCAYDAGFSTGIDPDKDSIMPSLNRKISSAGFKPVLE
jgi:hypothetical protein